MWWEEELFGSLEDSQEQLTSCYITDQVCGGKSGAQDRCKSNNTIHFLEKEVNQALLANHNPEVDSLIGMVEQEGLVSNEVQWCTANRPLHKWRLKPTTSF